MRTAHTPLSWSQGPRRMGTGKNADLLWVGNSWGSSFAKINTKTLATTIVPFPDPTMQPYHIAVDSKDHVWGNLWTSDRVVRLDPGTNAWTIFDLPVRGTEIRHIALRERGVGVFPWSPWLLFTQDELASARIGFELTLPRCHLPAQSSGLPPFLGSPNGDETNPLLAGN
jgi:hypothetical protein